MLLTVLLCSLFLAGTGLEEDDDWIDPYDMLNYDASTKSMRTPAEPAHYDNVPTKRREYTEDSNQVGPTPCSTQVADLQKQIEELKKKIAVMSQQPTCNPVFKRFLTRLRKEIQRVGPPGDVVDGFYDAKIKLSKQALTEIQTLLEGKDSWRTGVLDEALSQILVDLRPHNYEAWKWHFEDTFGVELDTVLKMGLLVLVIVAIICTQLWSKVSWFMQFSRLFAVCFFISIIWNWLYLYKIAFAEHQNNLAKMDNVYEKCTGVKKIDWSDSLKEWFRRTWTLQDDPCKKYYEVLMVNPILLVPPTKAIAVTITTFITEPLKHVGKGISEFLVALLKDLPITLQIPVLLTIVLAIVVCMYGGVHAAFQHGITAPFRRPRRDQPPPQLEQPRPQPRIEQIEYDDHLAGGDAPQQPAPRQGADDPRLHRNQVHQRRPNRAREQRTKVVVETLRNAEPRYSEDDTDAARPRAAEQNLSAESDSENQQEAQEEVEAEGAAANTTQSKSKSTDSSPSKSKPVKGNEKLPEDKPSTDRAAQRSQPPSHADVQASAAKDRTSSVPLPHVETIGVPVQETSPTPAE